MLSPTTTSETREGRGSAFLVATQAFSMVTVFVVAFLVLSSAFALPFIVASAAIWQCMSQGSMVPIDYTFQLSLGFGVILSKGVAFYGIICSITMGAVYAFKAVRKRRTEGWHKDFEERYSDTTARSQFSLRFCIRQFALGSGMLRGGLQTHMLWDGPRVFSPMADMVTQSSLRSFTCTIFGFILGGILLNRLLSKITQSRSQDPTPPTSLTEIANGDVVSARRNKKRAVRGADGVLPAANMV